MSASLLIPILEAALVVDGVDNVYTESPTTSNARTSNTNLFISEILITPDDGTTHDRSFEYTINILGYVGSQAATENPYLFMASIWDSLYDKLHRKPQVLDLNSNNFAVTVCRIDTMDIAISDERAGSTGFLSIYVRVDDTSSRKR